MGFEQCVRDRFGVEVCGPLPIAYSPGQELRELLVQVDLGAHRGALDSRPPRVPAKTLGRSACRDVSSAIAFGATTGRRRKSVVTTTATKSSLARSRIASTFSWPFSGESTFQPTTLLAPSRVRCG